MAIEGAAHLAGRMLKRSSASALKKHESQKTVSRDVAKKIYYIAVERNSKVNK